MIKIFVFIDTSVLVAFLNTRDENHPKAIKIVKDILSNMYGKPVISDYIFDELATVSLIRTKSIEITKFFGNYLINSNLIIIKVDDEIFYKSWNIFCNYGNISFTDCTILSLADLFKIVYLATFDKKLAKAASSNGIKVINK